MHDFQIFGSHALTYTKKISECMTSENLVTGRPGITLEEAKEILGKARKEKLPIVDDNYNLVGLITIKDIEKQTGMRPYVVTTDTRIYPNTVSYQ